MTQLDMLTTFFGCALGEIRRTLDTGEGGRRDNRLPGAEDAEASALDIRLIPQDDLGVKVPADVVRAVINRLVDACDLTHLTTITAVDDGEAIRLKYHFWQGHGLTLETTLSLAHLRMPTVTDIIPGAAFYEREVYGMFGVVFDGHADLQPLLLPDNWEAGPPLRKEVHDG